MILEKIVNLENRFPLFLNKLCWREIGPLLRKKSLHEEMALQSSIVELPKEYFISNGLMEAYKEGLVHRLNKPEERLVYDTYNAWVSSKGVIISNKAIHKYSSLHARLTPMKILKTLLDFYKLPHQKVEKASIISQQFVDQGTFGDYVIELLIPLAASRDYINQPILVENNYACSFLRADCTKLGIKTLAIPPSGVQVKHLRIIGSPQIYDNFSSFGTKALVKSFPVGNARVNKEGMIYLSRVGLVRSCSKRQREIKNETHIEEFLSGFGFSIIRPHECDNSTIRAAIHASRIVVGSHGSGLIHLAWGQPELVIELANKECWGCAFIKLALASGIKKYHVIETKNGFISLEELKNILNKFFYS
jgi:hypothetical protein